MAWDSRGDARSAFSTIHYTKLEALGELRMEMLCKEARESELNVQIQLFPMLYNVMTVKP